GTARPDAAARGAAGFPRGGGVPGDEQGVEPAVLAVAVPLAILAVPRWRLLLGWMTLDALVWVPRMMFYLGDDKKGLPIDWFLSFVVLRDLAVVGLCVLVVYEIYHPTRDLVRMTGDDDPAGGVLDGAEDKFVL